MKGRQSLDIAGSGPDHCTKVNGNLPAGGGCGRRRRPLSPPGAGRWRLLQTTVRFAAPTARPSRALSPRRPRPPGGPSPPRTAAFGMGVGPLRPRRRLLSRAAVLCWLLLRLPPPRGGDSGNPVLCSSRSSTCSAGPGPFAPELAARRSPLQAALPVLLPRCRFVVPVLEHRRSRRSLVLQPRRVSGRSPSAGFNFRSPAALAPHERAACPSGLGSRALPSPLRLWRSWLTSSSQRRLLRLR